MENATEREIGHLFGLIGGVLVLAGGLFATAYGVTDLVLGHAAAAAAALGGAVVLFVVGGLVLLFAHLANHGWEARPVASGVVLVVLALVDWAALGFGPNVLALVGGILALLAGVLYLVEPTQRAASAIVSTG
jgi:hypothetical protein